MYQKRQHNLFPTIWLDPAKGLLHLGKVCLILTSAEIVREKQPTLNSQRTMCPLKWLLWLKRHMIGRILSRVLRHLLSTHSRLLSPKALWACSQLSFIICQRQIYFQYTVKCQSTSCCSVSLRINPNHRPPAEKKIKKQINMDRCAI